MTHLSLVFLSISIFHILSFQSTSWIPPHFSRPFTHHSFLPGSQECRPIRERGKCVPVGCTSTPKSEIESKALQGCSSQGSLSGHQANKMSCSLVGVDLKAFCSTAVLILFLFPFLFVFSQAVTLALICFCHSAWFSIRYFSGSRWQRVATKKMYKNKRLYTCVSYLSSAQKSTTVCFLLRVSVGVPAHVRSSLRPLQIKNSYPCD